MSKRYLAYRGTSNFLFLRDTWTDDTVAGPFRNFDAVTQYVRTLRSARVAGAPVGTVA